MSTTPVDLCPCGQPLHYPNPATERFVREQIRELGAVVRMVTPDGAWAVPRHYIALHGIRAWELPELAKKYGWEVVTE
jgi:hypothetical protein